MSRSYLDPHLPAVVHEDVLSIVGRVNSLKAISLSLSILYAGGRTAQSDHLLLTNL